MLAPTADFIAKKLDKRLIVNFLTTLVFYPFYIINTKN